MFVPPGPVDVVVHVVRIQSQTCDVVDDDLARDVCLMVHHCHGYKRGLQELGNVKKNRPNHRGKKV